MVLSLVPSSRIKHLKKPFKSAQLIDPSEMQAAGEVADVVLLRNCPTQVVEAFSVSRATLQKIRENLAWAFGYNLVGVPVAAGALLPRSSLLPLSEVPIAAPIYLCRAAGAAPMLLSS
jgi:cation transport ATPase